LLNIGIFLKLNLVYIEDCSISLHIFTNFSFRFRFLSISLMQLLANCYIEEYLVWHHKHVSMWRW